MRYPQSYTMTTKRKKGQNWVNELKEILEERGYVVWKPALKAVFIGKGRVISSSQDIFECFDLVATSKERILWIQSKSQATHVYASKPDIDKLPMPSGTIRILTQRIPNVRHGFRAWIKTEDAWSKPQDFKELIQQFSNF